MSLLLSLTVVISLLAGPAGGNAQATAQRLDTSGPDPGRIADLEATGRRTEGQFLILWTPHAVLTDDQASALVARLDKGVAALRQIIGVHPWQAVRDQKIRYYISRDQFVSHALGGTEIVMIPLARLQDGRAPFLHEAAHTLTGRRVTATGPPLDEATGDRVTASRPGWLTEGIADYLGQRAAEQAGVTEGDVFDVGGFGRVDSTCAARLATPAGEEVLPYIAALGRHPGLQTTDRPKYAPTFYACAFSFNKFLAAEIGVQELIALMELQSRVDRSTNPISLTPDGVLPRIEKLTGRTMNELKSEWLKAIGASRR
jgi:hypothetical protein